jgi:hypothetical protein
MDDGWKETHRPTTNIGRILGHMTLKGKLDVVKLTKAKMDVVGDKRKGFLPSKIPVGKDKHLLTNGGFFWMSDVPEEIQSIGPTSLLNNFKPIPPQYREYYEKLEEDGQYLWAGPSLKSEVPINRREFDYEEGNYNIRGSLAHASQANERLAIAIVNGDKYIFAYTAKERRNGVNVNELRTIIDTFLIQFASSSISAASTALNLDGGGSVYVAWRKRGVEKVLARGMVHDDGPPWENRFKTKKEVRDVANCLQFTVANKAEGVAFIAPQRRTHPNTSFRSTFS